MGTQQNVGVLWNRPPLWMSTGILGLISYTVVFCIKVWWNFKTGISLVVWWLRIHLVIQGGLHLVIMWVQSLVSEPRSYMPNHGQNWKQNKTKGQTGMRSSSLGPQRILSQPSAFRQCPRLLDKWWSLTSPWAAVRPFLDIKYHEF